MAFSRLSASLAECWCPTGAHKRRDADGNLVAHSKGPDSLPYDVFGDAIIDKHTEFYEEHCSSVSSAYISVKIGSCRVKEFHKDYLHDDRHEFIRLHETPSFSKYKYNACIVWDKEHKHVQQLVFFVRHPQEIFFGQSLEVADMNDMQWNWISAIFQHSVHACTLHRQMKKGRAPANADGM